MSQPSAQQLESFGQELDALRAEVMQTVGQRDADYIRRIIRRQRYCEITGRALIHFSFNPLTWAVGSVLLGVAKILENMEIGHNVMHGQYDFMNDPSLHSQTYEWDTVGTSDSWRKTHNFQHHTYTNIIGKDRDFGYGTLRLSDDIPWEPKYRNQLFTYAALATTFQWGVAVYDLESDEMRNGPKEIREKAWKQFLAKARSQAGRDYLIFPLLAGPYFLKVLAGNAVANLIRNFWSSTVIFCGHFTQDVHTFAAKDCEQENRGQWYYRQLLGSSNFTGGRWLHLMSGHLSYQIEHHLFPDMPSARYPEIAPRVEAICAKYGVPYNSNTFWNQYKTVLQRILRYSRPPEQQALPT